MSKNKMKQLLFLDMKVIRSQVEKKTATDEFTSTSAMVFNITIHRKTTFTGLMTNSNSFVQFSYKKASVATMIQRAINTCSTYSLLAEELDRIRNLCHMNVYPRNFVDIRIGIGKVPAIRNFSKSFFHIFSTSFDRA